MVQSAVRDTHAPHQVVDISDLFLVGFGSKDDGGTPRPITWANPTVVEKGLNLGHDDLALMRAISRLPAAYRTGATSINSEFKMKDRFHDTGRVKAIPI